MLDPLQLYALLEAEESVRREFAPAPAKLWHESASEDSRKRARSRVAGWLRGVADRLSPPTPGDTARSSA